MELADLLSPSRVSTSLPAASKKRALEKLSGLMAAEDPALTQKDIFDSLLSRERLGSTGLGHGVAIPHGRLKKSQQVLAAFVRLENPVDYDAVDHEPVDLMFALLVPEESTDEHLQLLSQLAQMFSDPELLKRLRSASDSDSLFRLIKNWHSTGK